MLHQTRWQCSQLERSIAKRLNTTHYQVVSSSHRASREQKALCQHIHQGYYNCDLRRLVDNFKCDYCQRNKFNAKGYGFLPECEVRSIPFEECATDLLGPWTVQVHGNLYEYEALSVIDTVTNLVKLIRINDKRSQTVARKFVQWWLTHYPWPQHCVHDPGTEFTGPEFQMLLQNCHIKDVCTTEKIHSPMLCVKECTKQWETFWECCYMVILHKYCQWSAICRQSIINCYESHASRSTLHLRQQPRQSCV